MFISLDITLFSNLSYAPEKGLAPCVRMGGVFEARSDGFDRLVSLGPTLLRTNAHFSHIDQSELTVKVFHSYEQYSVTSTSALTVIGSVVEGLVYLKCVAIKSALPNESSD